MKLNKITLLFIITVLSLALAACSSSEAATAPELVESSMASSDVPTTIPEVAPEVIPLFGEFSTTDINGEVVDNTIFADYDVTMVSVWATTCPACIKEMPALAAINKKYADKKFQIIGVPMDTIDTSTLSLPVVDAKVALVHELAGKTGAMHTQIIPNLEMLISRLSEVVGTPSAYFVDKNGNIILSSKGLYVGARTEEQWSVVIDDLLLAETESVTTAGEEPQPKYPV